MTDSSGPLWIFGYGSLVWRPAFPHRRHRIAYVEGFARRFWQGSTDHRGSPEAPGRVVTLLPDDHPSVRNEVGFRAAPCWGTAYEIPAGDPDAVLERLDHRERGGYSRIELTLSLVAPAPPASGIPPRIEAPSMTEHAVNPDRRGEAPPTGARVRGVVYVAGPDNENYLGPAPIEAIAQQVATAEGPSGKNPEYVFELARSLRAMGAEDPHVFELADRLRLLLDAAPGSGLVLGQRGVGARVAADRDQGHQSGEDDAGPENRADRESHEGETRP